MVRIKYFFILVIITMIASCKIKKDAKSVLQQTFTTGCGCDTLWSNPVTQEFVAILEKTTSSNHPVWKNYNLGYGAFVLNAGQVNDTTHCLGLWKKGKALSFICAGDIPKMLTPLYSYYLNYKNLKEIDPKYTATYEKALEFSTWMKINDIETAVYMPTNFPKFPFKIPAKTKTQLAIHEAFHIEVMLRYWYTHKGFWPKWDKQPDRTGVSSCYTMNESTQSLIEKEQETLSLMIESLLDNKKPEAIRHGNTFLETREARYESLKDNQVKLADDHIGDCKTAEGLMEIEEGIADYASWVKMYDIGVVSREELIRRYNAKQKDIFYLTGCMLLHATVLMNGGKDREIISKMVNAKSPDEGNLSHIFKEQLAIYTKK